VLDQMNSHGAAIKIALLDASRRNSFEPRFRRYSAGLAAAVTPVDTLVLYSTAVGSVVSTSRNDHSLFVTELLKEMRAPGVTAEQALRNTQAGVSGATNREQIPWLSSSLTSEFSLSGGPIRPFDNGITKNQTEHETRKPACEVPTPLDAPTADEVANDPRVREMSRRIATDRNDRIAYYKRGQVYASKRAYALAVQDFGNAMRLDACDAESYNNRSWTRAVLGDLQAALKDCDMACSSTAALSLHWTVAARSISSSANMPMRSVTIRDPSRRTRARCRRCSAAVSRCDGAVAMALPIWHSQNPWTRTSHGNLRATASTSARHSLATPSPCIDLGCHSRRNVLPERFVIARAYLPKQHHS
jgi:tetratricopeptide (TPR) repeat protein